MSLPNTYTRLTYLQSSGTQYIDSGISGKFYVDTDVSFTNLGGYQAVIASQGAYASGANSAYVGCNGTTLFFCTTNGTQQQCGTITTNTRYNIKSLIRPVGQCYLYLNDVLKNSVYANGSFTNYNHFIFALKNDGGVASYAKMKLHYMKIYNDENGTLVRDFIPAKRNSDSVLGLYDLVNDVFYTNSGSGTFIGGTEIKTSVNPENSGTVDISETGGVYTITAQKNSGYKFLNWLLKGYTQLEYIQSNGGNCINTNVKQKYSENIKILFEYEPTYRSDSDYFGANGTTQCAISQSNGWQNNVKSACIVNHTANGNTTITLDGVLKNTFTYSGYDNIPIFLFALGISESGYNYTTKGKLYNAKIYDNSNTLVRDFIPVIRHSDGAIGLLDLVNLKFYGNSGSGTFIGSGGIGEENIHYEDNPLVLTLENDISLQANFKKTGGKKYIIAS